MKTIEALHRRRVLRATLALTTILSLCISCAPFTGRMSEMPCGENAVLGVEHIRSQKPADCLASCVDMVLHYYGIQAIVPDTARPLEMISFSHRLNEEALTDDQGYKLFAAVLELSPEEMAGHILQERPLILIYKPHSQKVYHSLVMSGYCPERDRFYTNDPARKKPGWVKLTKYPTFEKTGKYLVLLMALHEN